MGFPDSSVGKESTCNTADTSSIPGWGRSSEKGIGYPLQYSWASPVAQLVKVSACGRAGFDPCVGKIPWRKLPTPVFWPGWRIPWGTKESDKIFTFASLSYTYVYLLPTGECLKESRTC